MSIYDVTVSLIRGLQLHNYEGPATESVRAEDCLGSTQYIESNRRYWENLVDNHLGSKFYNANAFLTGSSTLHELELTEVGSVADTQLLHLYCHFGLDTLSWARNGAQVTGIDFSDSAIRAAESLARQAQISATFICADVAQAKKYLDRTFDIVYASYGVIRWIADLPGWARLAFQLTKSGGVLYLLDFHPILSVIRNTAPLHMHGSYFGYSEPLRYVRGVDYANRSTPITLPSYEWRHTLGEVVTAIAAAGYTIDYLHEHPESPEQSPALQPTPSGRWTAPDECLPALFSLRATRTQQSSSPCNRPASQPASEGAP